MVKSQSRVANSAAAGAIPLVEARDDGRGVYSDNALLKDASGIPIQQTENVQAARQIRFTKVRE